MQPKEKAEVLIEALPYLQLFRDKIFLIKIGGSAMESADLINSVMQDILFLEVAGIKPIILHGGGFLITEKMKQAGLDVEFVDGQRITTEPAMKIVAEVLSEFITPEITTVLRKNGGKAVGIRGNLVFLGERQKNIYSKNGNKIDLGLTGEVIGCKLDQIYEALNANIVPVISPIACELASGKLLNINADLAASALAKELQVAKLVYVSDVPGILENSNDESSLIATISCERSEKLIADKVILGGMIPKIRSAISAIKAGVGKIHFIDGRIPHSLLLEIFTDRGVGTQVVG